MFVIYPLTCFYFSLIKRLGKEVEILDRLILNLIMYKTVNNLIFYILVPDTSILYFHPFCYYKELFRHHY